MLTMNPFALPPIFSAVFIAVFGLYVLSKHPASRTHRAYFYFCLSVILWIFPYAGAYCSTSPEAAYRWARLSFYGVVFIPLTNFYFYVVMLKMQDKGRVLAGFLGVTLAFLAIHHATPLVYKGMDRFFWGHYTQAGPAHGAFLLFWAGVWTYGLRHVYRKMQEQKDAGDYVAYNQSKYVFFGYLGECLGFVDFLPKYGVSIYPFGYFCALYWVSIVGFAITHYNRLGDISFLTRRVLIGSGFFIVMASLFGLGYTLFVETLDQGALSVQSLFLLMGVSMGLGLLFQPLYRRMKGLVDRSFFPEYFERKEKLARLGQEILLSKDPLEFDRIILESLVSSFKIFKAALFLWNDEGRAFHMKCATGWGLQLSQNAVTRMDSGHPIAAGLSDPETEAILFDNLRRDFSRDNRELQRALLQLDATACVPIRRNGHLLGFFVLGDKESGLPYGVEDIRTLRTLASQTAVALENIGLVRRWEEGFNQKNQMEKILHQYLSASVADEVLRMADHAKGWKGDRRYVTVLMSDLRGFTSLSDNHALEDVVRWLNEYFSEMVEIILSYGGTVDKFMGDGILVVFGAPTPLPDPEHRAVACALDMQTCLKGFNRRRTAQGLSALEMGIGICAGDVVAGNIGSDKRREYTVIGDAVNIAARLQSVAEGGKILASANVVEAVKDRMICEPMEPLSLKGKPQPLAVSRIVGVKGEESRPQPDVVPITPILRALP